MTIGGSKKDIVFDVEDNFNKTTKGFNMNILCNKRSLMVYLQSFGRLFESETVEGFCLVKDRHKIGLWPTCVHLLQMDGVEETEWNVL